MKKFIALSTISATLLISIPSFAADFSDIDEDYLYFNSINQLSDNGCISGYEDGSFRPEQSVNRAEAIKILLTCLDLPNIYTEQTFTVPDGTKILFNEQESEANGETEVKFKIPFDAENYADLSFDDVDSEQWYVPFIKEAVVRKIITGYDDNTIRPFQDVNKAELYTILYRLTPEDLLQDLPEDSLADDIASGYWYYEPLQFAIQNQLLTTNDENLVSPLKNLTRANVAHFVYEYSVWLNDRIVSSDNEETEEEPQETETQEDTSQTEVDETEANTEQEDTQSDTSTESSTESTETDNENFTETGVASYYGYSFDGRRTASGQILDVEANMAAHKTLPFGTVVRVTNPETEKWVEVTIFDRGPFVEGRIIDLTPSTFEVLAPLSSGLVNVELEVISLPTE